MKKLFIFLLSVALVSGAAMAQTQPRSGDKRPPVAELKAQGAHVSSSVNDLVHLRFKKAHEKHLAEARRRNKGIAKDLRGEGEAPPRPNAPRVIIKQ